MAMLKKAQRITGRTLAFRNADESDAEFILSLRTDENKARHLTRTSASVEDQRAWLRDYAEHDGGAYFIVETMPGDKLGTVRLYDVRGDSFCWGSWILKDGAPRTAAVETALMVYAYAVDHCGFTQAHFEVRRENRRVCSFHDGFGARRVDETEHDIFYRMSPEAIASTRAHLAKFLPGTVLVEA